MDAFATAGFIFGLMGFVFALGALHRISKIEAELKRLKVIEEKFDSETSQ